MDNNITINKEASSNSSITLHVCRTGKKEQFYTLYEEGIVVRPYMCNYFCNYIRNLAHSKIKAMAKVEERKKELVDCGFWFTVEIEYHDSPRQIYARMEAFGAEFTTSKSGTTMWANATPEFWENWKTDKQKIKDAGFWVKRTNTGQWLVFVRRDADFDYS